MADAQIPWGLEALNGTISKPAWKRMQSWYLVASGDKMIPLIDTGCERRGKLCLVKS